MSTRHDPAAAEPEAAGGGSAWLDTASAGESAWDDLSDGDASAWAGPESSASVWDDDAPAPASVWDNDAPRPASVWDDDAPAPAAVWHDEPVLASAGTDEPARPRAAAPTGATKDARRRPRGGADPAHEQSPEVAAVAARLAEIVARSGGARTAAGPAPDDDGPGAATARPRPTAEVRTPEAGVAEAGAADVPASEARGRSAGSGGSGRRAGTRRSTAGRRRAPATEPPEAGAAATDAEPDPESVARAIALRQLTAAPRSRAQLAEAMAKRDVPDDVADRVLDRFTEVGLVDDAAYAEILVRSRHAERGMSRRALAMELRRKGVDDEVAREALEQVDDADEEQAARALARKKLRATRGLDREVRLRRAYGALGRRGYGGSLVSRVVREELDAEGADDGDGWPGGLGSA